MRYTRSSGFTLIELMVVLVIAAILLAIAVPSFGSLIKKNGVEALQSKFSSSVAMARSEAASRNASVTICRSSNGTACTGADTWKNGWIVFTDKNADGTFTAADDLIIDVYENLRPSYSINSDGAVRLTFNSQGFLTAGGASTFTVCEPDNGSAYARGLYVNTSGLIMKTKDTDATPDGIHDDPKDNANLDCT